jgi:ribosomal protein L11 methyltransferase
MNNEQSWFAVEITVVSEASEAVEFGLNELDALGTEINNLGKKPTETLCVIGYFNDLPNSETMRNQLNEALKIYGFSSGAIKNIDSRKIGNVDWLFEWKKHWKPTEIDKFIVAPTWETIENSSKIVIYIEPNMAFGTGTHETTRLCLQAIGENYQGEMSFLDVGTGTGILSIAAMKFKIQDSRFKIQDSIAENANRFWACDTDATSIEIAKENAELNDVAEINFYVGSISVETPSFDFVCANLTADVILPILPILIEKSNTFLILSGILKEQENSITQELNRLGVYNVKIETLGEWISVMIKSGE